MGWNLENTPLLDPAIADDELFGAAVSLSGDGARVAVGSTSAAENGHVRVFQWSASLGEWSLIGNFPGEAADDGFGNSVSLSNSGARLAIGAMFNDGGGDDAGHAQVYELVDARWTQMGIDLDSSTGNAFGLSLIHI